MRTRCLILGLNLAGFSGCIGGSSADDGSRGVCVGSSADDGSRGICGGSADDGCVGATTTAHPLF